MGRLESRGKTRSCRPEGRGIGDQPRKAGNSEQTSIPRLAEQQYLRIEQGLPQGKGPHGILYLSLGCQLCGKPAPLLCRQEFCLLRLICQNEERGPLGPTQLSTATPDYH